MGKPNYHKPITHEDWAELQRPCARINGYLSLKIHLVLDDDNNLVVQVMSYDADTGKQKERVTMIYTGL